MPKKKKGLRPDNRFVIKRKIAGVEKPKYFYSDISVADCEKQYREYLIRNGWKTGEDPVRFCTVADEWRSVKESTIAEYSFYTTYEIKLEKYILPYFGDRVIQNIMPGDVSLFFAGLAALSASTLGKIYLTLNSVFEYARGNYIIERNPCETVRPVSTYTPVIKPTYSREQADALLAYAKENQETDIVLLLATGMRSEELLALTWDDIDTDNAVIMINKALRRTKSRPQVSKPKTPTSRRQFPLDPDTAEYLASVRGSGYVVKGRAGEFMTNTGFSHNYRIRMTAICERLGIPYLPPHMLRHTRGTLWRDDGVDIYTISKALGHANIDITDKRYIENKLETLRTQLNTKRGEVDAAEMLRQLEECIKVVKKLSNA